MKEEPMFLITIDTEQARSYMAGKSSSELN